jgi:hypothetical protein
MPPDVDVPFWDWKNGEVKQVGYLANGDLRPAIMVVFWNSGYFYLYKIGLPGGNK